MRWMVVVVFAGCLAAAGPATECAVTARHAAAGQDAQQVSSDCGPGLVYSVGARVPFPPAGVADASGPVDSVTYTAADGAVVVVTRYRFDTRPQLESELARLMSGTRRLSDEVRCSCCARDARGERHVYRRDLRQGTTMHGIIRTTDLGFTLIVTQHLAHALDVECLLHGAPRAK